MIDRMSFFLEIFYFVSFLHIAGLILSGLNLICFAVNYWYFDLDLLDYLLLRLLNCSFAITIIIGFMIIIV